MKYYKVLFKVDGKKYIKTFDCLEDCIYFVRTNCTECDFVSFSCVRGIEK